MPDPGATEQTPTHRISEGWQGRRIAITGGAGFVGTHLAEALVKDGAAVTILDNFQSGVPENLERLDGRVTVMSGDLRDSLDALTGTDYVFHCAARSYVPPSLADPEGDMYTNASLTLYVLEWVRNHTPATKVLVFSSAAVYGSPRMTPVTEDHPLAPLSPYGVSKLASDRYANVYASALGLRTAVLRCFAIYGPRQRKQVVFDLMNKLRAGEGAAEVIGTGDEQRDLCYVADIVRAARIVALRAAFQGEVYNAGGTVGIKIGTLAEMIGQAMGFNPRLTFTGVTRPGDPDVLVADCGRLHSLGWQPEINFERGLAETVEWFSSLSDHTARY